MPIRPLALAQLRSLITRDTVKLRLGLEDASADTLLDVLILEATDAIEAEIHRTLIRQQYLQNDPQTHDPDAQLLYLAEFPIDRDQVTLTIDGVAKTDFEVREAATGLLFRESGWPTSDLDVTFFAGYISPDAITGWVNDATLVTGRWVRPSAAANFTKPLLFEVTVGGTAAVEPVWPTVAGGSIDSGDVTFVARDAQVVPEALQAIAFLVVADRYHKRDQPGYVRSMQAADYREDYGDQEAASDLPRSVLRSLNAWRWGR